MELERLRHRCQGCNQCGLRATCRQVVFGCGAENAHIMLVGEGPGEREDALGEPFVGAAGKLLDDMLSIIDLSRNSNVYIANIVKCRPPGNRDPKPEEQAACIDHLYEQIRLVQPKMIVCLGRIAAKKLIDEQFAITKQHGSWIEKEGILYTAIYHPSALLRDVSKRPETFMDLLSIRERARALNIPI